MALRAHDAPATIPVHAADPTLQRLESAFLNMLTSRLAVWLLAFLMAVPVPQRLPNLARIQPAGQAEFQAAESPPSAVTPARPVLVVAVKSVPPLPADDGPATGFAPGQGPLLPHPDAVRPRPARYAGAVPPAHRVGPRLSTGPPVG